MKKILEIILASYARLALNIHKPTIIGITGSVGKTSTKDAIALVLSTKYKVNASPGNLNSQLGLPLAVLGFKKAGGFKKNLSTVFGWFGILIAGFFKIFNPNYPKVLVLEMGTDKPGDIGYLLHIAGNLDFAVVTDIGISHLEFFSSPESLAREKLSLLKGLNKNGTAILNADNTKVLNGKNQTKAKVVTYSTNQEADVFASNVMLTEKNGKKGIGFKLNYAGNRVPSFIPNAIGDPAVYAALAAASVGISFNLNLVEISQALENYKQPPGRLQVIEGINNSTIIDDTYNSSPASTKAALNALVRVPGIRKVAALGHMAELGAANETGHREVAVKILETDVRLVFLVGEKSKIIQEELLAKGFNGKVLWFADSDTAKNVVKENILAGDVILVKGSQSARMEKIVKEIMAHPEKSQELLVRQSHQWLE